MSEFSAAFADGLDEIYAVMGDAAKYRAPGAAGDGSEDEDCVVIIDRDSERLDLGDMGQTRADGYSAMVRRSDLEAIAKSGTIRPSEGDYSGKILTVLATPEPIENNEWRLTVKVAG